MTDRGFTDQIKGKAKEVAGTITGDTKLKAEGLADQAIGKAKEIGDTVKSTIEEVAERQKTQLKKNFLAAQHKVVSLPW